MMLGAILVPLDGSSPLERALPIARSPAERFHREPCFDQGSSCPNA